MSDIINKVKWKLQRVFRGYSDCDLWNLDIFLAEQILTPLKAWRKLPLHGYDSSCKSREDWMNHIDKMILSFELVSTDLDVSHEFTTEDYKIRQRKIEEGLKLFAKHFQSLWD